MSKSKIINSHNYREVRKFVILPDGSMSSDLNSSEVIVVSWIGEVAMAEGKKAKDLPESQVQKISVEKLLEFNDGI